MGIQLVRKLWAGFTAGLLCSAVVGAVHFAAYSCARKWLLPITCPSCKPEPANHAPAPHGTAPGACSVPDVHTRTHAASDNAPEDKETAPGKLAATLLAAVFAAAMTAMVESPVELFRYASRRCNTRVLLRVQTGGRQQQDTTICCIMAGAACSVKKEHVNIADLYFQPRLSAAPL